jgi:uncharacterized protein with von Willebrand factor type A (vWA) domain
VPDSADLEAPFVSVLVDFGRELRAAGVPVGSGDVLTYCSAMAPLDPSDLLDLYWAGRATLLTRREQIPVYDNVFRRYFLDEAEHRPGALRLQPRSARSGESVLQVPQSDPGNAKQEQALLGLAASDAETLRRKSFPACTPDERAALRRIMRRISVVPPRRRTRRTAPASSGRAPDPRRTMRETLRRHGEPAELFWRRRRVRLRPLILILDVSGSMADYSRALLQFAYSARRAQTRVEVFCFGTRLTRITRTLQRRDIDGALALAAAEVFDWDGGTRIGESLQAFVRGWARRGLGRGGIVVICSDGLDRGDPAVLAAATERLSRLCHKLVWVNPHATRRVARRTGASCAVPNTVGMLAAAPYLDLVVSGSDLRSLEELAALLPELG